MTQESGGADPQNNPPSFIPAGARRTRPSGQVPRSYAPANGARTRHSASDHANPTSHTASSAGASSTAGSAIPPSFSPNAGRAGRVAGSQTSAKADPVHTSRSSMTPSSQPRIHGASNSRPDGAVPRSIPPAAARRSSGSASNIARAWQTPLSAAKSQVSLKQASAGTIGTGYGSLSSAATPRKRHAARITACAIAVLLAALVLSVFSAWNWVNGRLTKTDWLTDAADTPAQTWLILGSDERDGSTQYGGVEDISGFRTDTILVLIKPKSGPSSLISIPRDSLINIDDQYMKINAVAQLVSKQSLVSTVEQISGQKIDHVAQVKFGGLQNVVDALGGVELCYDQDVQDAYSGLDWKAGCHTANGATALSFSRMRYADVQGDFGRNARQRQVISAIVKKASSASTLTNPSKVFKVADASMKALTVDEKATPSTLLSMALAFKDATGSSGISGSVYWSDPDYYVDGVGSSVLLDDTKNTELFKELASGTHKAGQVGNLADNS
ncbi:LCP family protein [Bifidobacterium olomucense]|uniref:Transcriptional regulator n=1 Tax=Bifidobacterium olomucense TaxID=2675324 RepID=A0A7Y0EXM4_9BIFI|nr:transcriptional regulator [Bifidobacterium sp. DSM 109959]